MRTGAVAGRRGRAAAVAPCAAADSLRRALCRSTAVGHILLRLLRNPMIIGMLGGIAFSLLGWKLPGPLAQTVGMFAMTTGALSLFFVGCTLAGLPMHGMVESLNVSVATGVVLYEALRQRGP